MQDIGARKDQNTPPQVRAARYTFRRLFFAGADVHCVTNVFGFAVRW